MKVTFTISGETIGAIFCFIIFFAFFFALAKISNPQEASEKKMQYTQEQYAKYYLSHQK